MIPLLLVSDESVNFEELADELGEYGSRNGLVPYIAGSAKEALDVFGDERNKLFLTILGENGKETFIAMKKAGYDHSFFVCGDKNKTRHIESLGAEYLDMKMNIEEIYATVLNEILY